MPVIKVIPVQSLVTNDLALKDKNVIVIDILRAGSTMLTALSNGAKEIIPAETTTIALRIAKGLGKNALLCGEREGKIISGFNLGNSPFEYSDNISGKTLIFSTTNGTVSIHKSRYAKNCILACFLNFTRVIEFLQELNEDFIIMSSGKLNGFCLEDFVFAGALIDRLIRQNENKNIYKISDAEVAAVKLSELFLMEGDALSPQKILDMFLMSEHGKYLKSIGYEKDLEYCSKLDVFSGLPVFSKGLIKLKDSFEAEEIRKKKFKKINLKKATEK